MLMVRRPAALHVSPSTVNPLALSRFACDVDADLRLQCATTGALRMMPRDGTSEDVAPPAVFCRGQRGMYAVFFPVPCSLQLPCQLSINELL